MNKLGCILGLCRNPGEEHPLGKIINLLERITMQNQELYTAITNLQAQTAKVQTEITGKIAELNAAVASAMAASGGEVPQNVVDAMAAVTAAVNTLDALVPDAPAPSDPNAAPAA